VIVYAADPQSRTSPLTFSSKCSAGLLANAAGIEIAHIAAADANPAVTRPIRLIAVSCLVD
jgi:hypothetical protein